MPSAGRYRMLGTPSHRRKGGSVQTSVAIIGAGPAGLLLGHILSQAGIPFVILERQNREHVLSRIRAGVLEQGSVDLLAELGLDTNLRARGLEHGGIYLQYEGRAPPRRLPGARRPHGHRLRPAGPRRRHARRARAHRLQDRLRGRRRAPAGDRRRASDRVVHAEGTAHENCDATSSSARTATTVSAGRASRRSNCRSFERSYPFAWLGILADVAAVDRRPHLRPAPRRVRHALHALAAGLPPLPAGRAAMSRSTTGAMRASGKPADPARRRRLDARGGPDHREVDHARCAASSPRRSAQRPAVPRRGRRAHRAADRREGAQLRHRRRRPARPGAARAPRRRRLRSRRATATVPSRGSGRCSTSRSG